MNFTLFLVFLAHLAPVLDLLAAPEDILNTPNCHAYQCINGNSDFVQGQVYTYDYEVTSVTQMKSSPQDSSSLSIKSRAKIQALSACRFSLQVRFFKQRRILSQFICVGLRPCRILSKSASSVCKIENLTEPYFSWTTSKLREMIKLSKMLLRSCLDLLLNSSWKTMPFHMFVPTKKNPFGLPTSKRVYFPVCNPLSQPPNWALTSLRYVSILNFYHKYPEKNVKNGTL